MLTIMMPFSHSPPFISYQDYRKDLNHERKIPSFTLWSKYSGFKEVYKYLLLTFNNTSNKCGDTTFGRRKWISCIKMSKWQELNTQKRKTSMCIIFTSHKIWKQSIIRNFTFWDWICKHYNKTCSSFCANKATRLL